MASSRQQIYRRKSVLFALLYDCRSQVHNICWTSKGIKGPMARISQAKGSKEWRLREEENRKGKERVNGFQNTSKDRRTLMKSGIRSFGTSVFQHCRSQRGGGKGRQKTIEDQERLKFGGSSSSFIGTAPHSRTILLKSRTTFSGTRSHNSDLE